MSTSIRKLFAAYLILAMAVLVGVAPRPANAAVDTQQVAPAPSSTATAVAIGKNAQQTAYDILGDRPFQAVLMSNGRVVMTASSVGTSPFTDVPVASIAKLVTSMTVMRLIELGKLSLERSIGAILGETLVPEAWRPVTVAQLLAHTSGFAPDRDRWFNDTYSSCLDAFTRIVQRDAPAGAGYQYSNTNYCALSLVIGAVSGPSYDDAVYRLLLRPLGIDRKVMDEEYAHLAGAGGWRMSALDIARITSALDPSAPSSPISTNSRTTMIQRTKFDYGLGVWIFADETYGHSGSLYRARNIAVRLPSGRTAVIMTQATFPESGLELLPLAQRIDAAFAESCTSQPCEVRGLDPFGGMPHGMLGRSHV